MADITVEVLEPAEGYPAETMSFLSLEEAKLLLGLHTDDTANDEQLKFQIAIASSTIMTACNRMFARQKVAESWRELGSRRLFLTHWPVKRDDIESVLSGNQTLGPGAYELEERSGKLSNFAGSAEPVVVTYSGGFELPEGAELPLKQATELLVRLARHQATAESIAGIRMIGHKESRVMFFDPNAVKPAPAVGGGALTGNQSVELAAARLHPVLGLNGHQDLVRRRGGDRPARRRDSARRGLARHPAG